MLPKLAVASIRNIFTAKHRPASNRYRLLTCENVIAVDAQIRADNINPTSVLRKFTNTLPSLYMIKPSGRFSVCNEASHSLATVPNNFAERRIKVDGTIRQNNKPFRFAV